MELSLDKIEFDEEIYPRKQISHTKVKEYLEDLKGGATFPPIEVQKVKYEDGEKIICLDGKHRLLAIEEFNKFVEENENDGWKPILEVKAKMWKDEALDREKDFEQLLKRAAVLNRKHGFRLSSRDLAKTVLTIIKLRPLEKLEGVVNELAEYFDLYPSSISQLETEEGKVSDVLAKRRLSRDIQIYRMYKLGWTQDEIGRIFNLSQPGISRRILQISKNEICNIQHQYFENKKSVEEIAQFHNMDVVTTWSMILEGKSGFGGY